MTFPEPEIRNMDALYLIGKHCSMSLRNNQTKTLWQSFMPLRHQIKNTVGQEVISMQIYPASFDFTFSDEGIAFEKWAARRVTTLDHIPDGMEGYRMEGGLYAVFNYKGLSTDPSIFRFIFGAWLPASEYVVDHRPHFEVLGEKYKNQDPDSEEEIWIPVRRKNVAG